MVIMAYPRKYVNRYTTAINIERKKKDLLELLNIELTHAVNIGADSLISHAIKTRSSRAETSSKTIGLVNTIGTRANWSCAGPSGFNPGIHPSKTLRPVIGLRGMCGITSRPMIAFT